MEIDNPNPQIFESKQDLNLIQLENRRRQEVDLNLENDDVDALEIFDLIRHINDPEHPLTLEQLNVVQLENVKINDNHIVVYFTPTIPHCSMASLIGLSILIKLQRSLPNHYKIDVLITPGSHNQEKSVNKQLNDKERTSAAIETNNITRVVNNGIAQSDKLHQYMFINKF